jgi:hypothetical protein
MKERCFVIQNFHPLTCGLHDAILMEYRVASANSMAEINQAKNYATCHVCPKSMNVVHYVTDI